jgi:hypothetical protein
MLLGIAVAMELHPVVSDCTLHCKSDSIDRTRGHCKSASIATRRTHGHCKSASIAIEEHKGTASRSMCYFFVGPRPPAKLKNFLQSNECAEVEHVHLLLIVISSIFPMLLDIRVLDNLKDYAVRALVNAVDHLGTVAYKLTDLYEQQASEVSTLELKVACLNQVLPLP